MIVYISRLLHIILLFHRPHLQANFMILSNFNQINEKTQGSWEYPTKFCPQRSRDLEKTCEQRDRYRRRMTQQAKIHFFSKRRNKSFVIFVKTLENFNKTHQVFKKINTGIL